MVVRRGLIPWLDDINNGSNRGTAFAFGKEQRLEPSKASYITDLFDSCFVNVEGTCFGEIQNGTFG